MVSRHQGQLDPEIRRLVDSVIVPELVRQFLAEMKGEKEIALDRPPVVELPDSGSRTARENV